MFPANGRRPAYKARAQGVPTPDRRTLEPGTTPKSERPLRHVRWEGLRVSGKYELRAEQSDPSCPEILAQPWMEGTRRPDKAHRAAQTPCERFRSTRQHGSPDLILLRRCQGLRAEEAQG